MLLQQKKLCQTAENQLTPEEIAWVYSLYYKALKIDGKPTLKQILYMSDGDIYDLCSRYDSRPFKGTKPAEWLIVREGREITVSNKSRGHECIIDIDNGDVHILREGMRSHLGTAAYAFQFLLRNGYALPLDFGRGHSANGKTALQLGIAIPDMTPLKEALKQLYNNDETLINDYFSDKLYHGIQLINVDVFNAELTEIKKQLDRKG